MGSTRLTSRSHRKWFYFRGQQKESHKICIPTFFETMAEKHGVLSLYLQSGFRETLLYILRLLYNGTARRIRSNTFHVQLKNRRLPGVILKQSQG